MARHFFEGHDFVRAAKYAQEAGQQNDRIFDWSRSLKFYNLARQALVRLPDTIETRRRRIDVCLRQAGASYAADDQAGNLERLAEAEALAKSLSMAAPGEPPDVLGVGRDVRARLLQIYRWRATTHMMRNEQRQSIEYAEQLVAAAQREGAESYATLGASLIGRSLYVQGHFAKARPLLQRGRDQFVRAANWIEGAYCTVLEGLCLAQMGEYVAAVAAGRRALEQAQSRGNLTAVTFCQSCLAYIHLIGDNLRRAVETGQAAAAAAERSGDRIFLAVGLGVGAWAASRLGDYPTAWAGWADYDSVVRGLGGADHRHLHADTLEAARAETLLGAGHSDQALERVQLALHLADISGNIYAIGLAERVWGQAQAATAWDEVGDHLMAALRCFEEGEARLEAARTRVAWGQLLRDRGDLAAACEHLEKAAAQFEASGLTEELERTRGLLAELK